MSSEERQILDMLAAGKISVDEAEKLLGAVREVGQTTSEADHGQETAKAPSYLHVQVEPKDGRKAKERVNIRIPLKLVKGGLKLGSILPGQAQVKINHALGERGLDLDLKKLNSESIDALMTTLSDLCIDVDDEDERVRIFCK